MKNYIDGFYELIHKNSLKRRRMVSLLLVLSMFVSTGVLWELRDTGITMVNDAQCGLEEHTHTDECYQDVLICGLEENEEHTHTAECYERRLVCGYEDHIHGLSCYGIEEEPVDEITDNDVFALSGTYEYLDESEEESEEEILLTDLPELTLDNEVEVLASQEVQNAPYINPGTETTIDNIAEGIKFTLFDYGDSIVESQRSRYRWVFVNDKDENGNNIENQGVWTHPKSEDDNTDGWKDSGINTGRNPEDDILFFVLGTPVDRYVGDNNVHNLNVPGDNGYTVTDYLPDKNSYSGDYFANPVYSGNRPVSGIVDSTLTNGYPTVNANGHHSLDYLFNNDNLYDSNGNAYKTVYTDVNHLLMRDPVTNHLIFNSNDNYAYYDKDTGNFTVYDRTYPVINDDHHKVGDTNYSILVSENPDVYKEYDDPKPEFKIGFFPFNEYDPTKRDPNWNSKEGYYNHHFGMKMETKFTNPTEENLPTYLADPNDPNSLKKEPVSFKYSGDDDMWVFVDGYLVLDIGGIHEPTGGMIDFTNGLVWTQDNELGRTMDEVKSDLISASGNGINNETDFNNLPKPIGTDTTGSGDNNKWFVTRISDYVPNWDSTKYGEHEIKMFYLERGGCYSNLAMEMNLPTLKPLTVKKEVDYQDHLVKDTDIDDKDYKFQVWERVGDDPNTPEDEGYWIKPNLPQTTNGAFTLKDGERIIFEDLEQHRQFRITEEDVNPNVYDQVSVNGVTMAQLTAGGTNVNVDSSASGVALSDTNSYLFNNRVIQDTTKIKVKKDWDCTEDKKPANFTMKYKIMRTDSATGEVKQVALKYEVEDPVTHETKTKKRRVFLLEPNEQLNGKTTEDLLARYGNHVYTYTVEELNVPDGFKASYSDTYETDSESGKQYKVLQVTNTDITKTDIYVKKEWENIPTTGQPAVKLVLKREKVGYSSSQATSLKVNILDEGGNLIRTETFTNLYSNGSAEIYYDMPEGVVIYRGDPAYPNKRIGSNTEVPLKVLTCTISDPEHEHNDECYNYNNNKVNEPLYVKFEEDENILVVKNLAAKGNPNDPDEIANEVTFKVTSDNAEDSLLLLHHSFTRGTNGWETNTLSPTFQEGDEVKYKVSPSSAYSYAKGDALVVQGRENAWNGVKLVLDPDKFKANKTYSFSVYVYSPQADDFKMTFNNGLGGNQPLHLFGSNAQSLHVNGGSWEHLTGTLQLTNEIDPYNMYLLIETLPLDNDYEASQLRGGNKFYIDEFTAIEGSVPVSVSAQNGTNPGGVVTIGEAASSGGQVYYYNFNNYDEMGDGWTTNDSNNENGVNHKNFGVERPSQSDLNNGMHYVRVFNRDNTHDGIQRQDVSFLQRGKTYIFKVVAQHDGSGGANDVHLTLYVPGGVVYNGQTTNYPWVCNVDITPRPEEQYPDYVVSNGEGVAITIPSDADIDNMYMYFETGDNTTNKYGNFRIHSVEVIEVGSSSSTSTLPPKSGYMINEYGQYVSNYSNYDLDLDENSVTNPLHLDGQYILDSAFSKEITLPTQGMLYDDGTGKMMGYHWGKADLNEQSQTLYRYWIEEEWIGSDGNTVTTRIELNGDDKTVISEHDDYIISYDRQFVSTNTEQSPILVTNKYIWYKLPATGGRGTTGIYVLGAVLTTFSILSGCAAYRRRRRRE